MSSSSPGTNASSGSGTKSLTEAGAPCAPAVPFRLPGVLGTVPHACHRGKRRRSMAVGLQSSCSRFAVFALAAIDPFPIRSIASCCLPLAALPLLVCAACPVSVSVRLACVGRTRSTRDPGHHSRFVQCFLLLLAAAAPALGFDGVSCGNLTHRVEPIPKARGCAGCARGQTTPVEERAEGRTALRGCTV